MQEPNADRTNYGPVGWLALVGGLLIGWRVWQWQAPTGDEINAAGAESLVLVAFAAWWAFLALIFGAMATYGILKGLGAFVRFFGQAFAEGWRREFPKD